MKIKRRLTRATIWFQRFLTAQHIKHMTEGLNKISLLITLLKSSLLALETKIKRSWEIAMKKSQDLTLNSRLRSRKLTTTAANNRPSKWSQSSTYKFKCNKRRRKAWRRRLRPSDSKFTKNLRNLRRSSGSRSWSSLRSRSSTRTMWRSRWKSAVRSWSQLVQLYLKTEASI